MTTSLQAAVVSQLNKREQNSLRALQNKVDKERGHKSYLHVSNAQMVALQAAYDAAKASGLPIPPAAVAAAAQLGLK